MPELDGRVVATLGATGGIGGAIHAAAGAAGARAIALGRDAGRLAALGGEGYVCDLADEASWPTSLEALPPLDGLVVCSGHLAVLPFRATPPQRFAESIALNLTAPALLLRHLLRARKLQQGASIVFIGSIAGRRGAVGHAAYGAAKAGLVGLVRTLALELAGQAIRVNVVSPGLVRAGMGDRLRDSVTAEQFASYEQAYPLGIGAPDDVAPAVIFLLSAGARWITGVDLPVDGGVTLR